MARDENRSPALAFAARNGWRALKGFVAVTAVLLALVFLGVALVQIGSVRQGLLQFALTQINSGDTRLTADDIGGTWPRHLTLENLQIADAQGVWLSAKSLDMEWQPFALLAGEMHVISLKGADIALERLPGGSTETTPSDGPLLPSLPVTVRVDALALENFRLGKDVLGEEVVLDATGEADYGSAKMLRLLVDRRGDTPGHLEADLNFDDDLDKGLLKLSLRDGASGKPGLLSRLTDIPELGSVTLDADGEARDGVITSLMTIDAGRGLTAKAEIHGQAVGALDLSFTTDANGRLVAEQIDALGGGDRLHASGRLRRDDDDAIQLSELDLQAGKMALTGELSLGNPDKGGMQPISGKGRVKGIGALIAPGEESFMGDMAWSIEGTGDLDQRKLHLEPALLTSLESEIRFTGDLDLLDGFAASGDAQMMVSDVAPLARLAGQTLHGRAEIHVTPFDLNKDGSGAGDLELTLENVRSDDPLMQGLLGQGLLGEGSVLFSKDGLMALPSFNLQAPDRSLMMSGNLSIKNGQTLDGKVTLAMSDAARSLPGMSLAGKLDATAQLSGTLDAPRGTLDAEISKGSVAGFDAETMTVLVTAEPGATGPVSLTLDGSDGHVDVTGQLRLPAQGGGAELTKLEADIFGARLTGDVALNAAGRASGKITGDKVGMATIGRLVGVKMRGRADMVLTLEDKNAQQNILFTMEAPRLAVSSVKDLTMEKARLTASLRDLGGTSEKLAARFGVESATSGLTQFSRFDAVVTGPLDAIDFDIDVEGREISLSPEDVLLHVNATWLGDKARLRRLNFAIGKSSLVLTEPVMIEVQNGVRMKDLRITSKSPFGAGHLNGNFTLIGNSAIGDLDIASLPIALLAPILPLEQADGLIDGTAKLNSGQGTGKVALSFRQVRLTQTDLTKADPFDASFDGNWARNRLRFEARAKGTSEIPFQLQGSVPMIRAAGGAFPTLPAKGPVDGSLKWRGPVASLLALGDFPGHKMTGVADISLTASGDISNPEIDGKGSIKNGSYENYELGTLLKDLQLSLTAQGSELLTFEMSANDGGKGRMTSTGVLSLARDANPALSIKNHFENAHLLHQRDMDMALSGDVELSAAAFPLTAEKPLLVKGALTTELAQYRIPDELPGSVPEISWREINGGRDGDRERDIEAEGSLPIELDVTIDIGEPARVSGRGLTSLWTGGFNVSGQTADPKIAGTLSALRGSFDLGGKTFSLTKGTITFNGTTPINPILNLVFTHKRSDLTASIAVTGTANAPKIALASTPSLPRDEIISRVLFAKGVGELSAIEAAQLANTLAVVSGKAGGGGSLVGKLQDSLGLDVLSVDKGASGDATVSAGKYLREGVYVGVEQGANAADSNVKVEIEVSPHISVDTKIGQAATSDVGVNWKWDY
ncbi:MAG: hypothetical protein GC184_09740 [Rhizobiales bacterium]|nr:hypothetical protein [Hyphomicrobiales bacterium]